MTLIAATETGHGYGPDSSRRARIPRWATFKAVEAEAKARRKSSEQSAGPSAGDVEGTATDVEMRDPIDPKAVREHVDHSSDDQDDSSSGSVSDESESQGGGDEDEENPNDIDEEYSKRFKWPLRAYHNERVFGYAFNAGESVFRESITTYVRLHTHDHANPVRYRFRISPDWDLPASSEPDMF